MNQITLLQNSFWVLVAVMSGVRAIAQAPAVQISQSLQIPDSLRVPTDQQLQSHLVAKGDQIYLCHAVPGPTAFKWLLKAPEATLSNESQTVVGKHFAGPSWQMNDRSTLVGKLQAKVDAPQADAIPWLLLKVKFHYVEGAFSSVNWIQRLHTVGGKAPTDGCDRDHQDAEVRVPYTADYYFYGDAPKQ
ncbi:MAG: DUF3455 domain-containing protein [Leptolyngbya sp. BL-A-14]